MAREGNQDDVDGLELVHPVYLDVPMLVSFVAAIEGGATFGSEETETGAMTRGRSREGTGRARAGLPAIGALLGIDLSGRYGRKDEDQESKETKIVRRHTEASLFNLLRERLESEGRITVIESKDRLGELDVGQLVELTGEIVGNPVERMLGLIRQILPYLGYDMDAAKPKKHKQVSRGAPRADVSARRVVASQDGGKDEFSEQEVFGLLATMGEELNKSSIRDLVLIGEGGLRAVLTLSTEFLAGTADEYLLGGRFTVIGKLTRVLHEGESINLMRRTALGLGGPELACRLVDDVRETESLFVEIGDPVVEPPGVQLLPLAVFV